MGEYTQIIFSARLKYDDNIKNIINWLMGNSKKPGILPDHDFFKTNRHDMIMTGASAYFPQTASKVSFYKDEEIRVIFSDAYKIIGIPFTLILMWVDEILKGK